MQLLIGHKSKQTESTRRYSHHQNHHWTTQLSSAEHLQIVPVTLLVVQN